MFGPRIGTSTFSFGKLLGGLSKTLGVVNQVIPIYKEAKPIIQNARTAFNLVKELGSTTTNRIMTAPAGFIPKAIIKKGNDVRTIELEADDAFQKSICKLHVLRIRQRLQNQ